MEQKDFLQMYADARLVFTAAHSFRLQQAGRRIAVIVEKTIGQVGTLPATQWRNGRRGGKAA